LLRLKFASSRNNYFIVNLARTVDAWWWLRLFNLKKQKKFQRVEKYFDEMG